MDEEQVHAAWREWFRGYVARWEYDVAGDAVKAAFLAGVQWAQQQQEEATSG
jgi:hypothetical protein